MSRSRRNPPQPLPGIRKRDKQDFFAGCNEQGKAYSNPNAYEFMRVWCKICKNGDCIRAKGSSAAWEERMETQAESFLNNPRFSDFSTEEHRALGAMMFNDISAKAQRLEIAAQRQDWEIPSDGIDRAVGRETTSEFDVAVRALARAKGVTEPVLPTLPETEAPTHFQEASAEKPPVEKPSSEDIEYETQYPSSDRSRTYRILLTKAGKWSCECDGFRHVKRCKHLPEVQAWYAQYLETQAAEKQYQAELEAEQQRRTALPPAPTQDPRVPVQRPMNTPVPQGGFMLGPDPVPSPQQPAADPWAPRHEPVVPVGGKVVLRSKKEPPP